MHAFCTRDNCIRDTTGFERCENTLSERSDLIADQTVWVGASKQVPSTEVPNGLSQADSRNLRFALTAS